MSGKVTIFVAKTNNNSEFMGRYIRFDWAAKHILRNKADFVVFEGLISALVGEEMTILEMLESEGNKETRDDKHNRVDIMAKNAKGEIIIVEIQQTRELDYLQRMIYGVAKTIVDHMFTGMAYKNVKKVYSINILYFDIGGGDDYLYCGQAELRGVHNHDVLDLTEHERDDLNIPSPKSVFPTYYVIRVNSFHKEKLDSYKEEWMDYLKNERIRPDTTAPGLREAKQRLDILAMTDAERREYEHYMDTLVRDTDVERTKILEAEITGRKKGLEEGRAEGLQQGLEKGLEKGRVEGRVEGREERTLEIARRMKTKGSTPEEIASLTDLAIEEIEKL